MKKIFYSILLLVFTCIIPSQVYAEEMPSWEGVYCDQATDNCMKIYDQAYDTDGQYGTYYAQIMFYNPKNKAFIAEGEFHIDSHNEGFILSTHLVSSEDRKSIQVKVNPYFSSWGDDSINNYGHSLLFGDYVRVE